MVSIPGVDMNTALSLPTDNQWSVVDPQGRTDTVTSYNNEVTGVPECLVDVVYYSDNWSYWRVELRRRGWIIESIDDRHVPHGSL